MAATAAPAERTSRLPPRRCVTTPTLLQMEAAECGAAALGIVLGSHGRIVALEELRRECGVSRDGSKASNIINAARRYGLAGEGKRLGQTSGLYDLQFPVILFWNLNHFVVLEGFHAGKAFINDPALGRRRITLVELDEAFSGIVLTFTPGPAFERRGKRPSALGSLRSRLADSAGALLYVTLCGLLLVAPGLLAPTFTRVFIDEYLLAGHAFMVRPILVAMLATAVVLMALTWLQGYYLLRLETKLALVGSSRFFAHIQRLPISYFLPRYAGDIGARIAINDRIALVIAAHLTTMAINVCVLVFYLALMLIYDVPLTLAVIAVAAINVIVLKVVAREREDASRRLLQDRGKLQGAAVGGLAMIETLKACGGEAEFFARWSGQQAKCLLGEQSLSLVTQVTGVVPSLVGGLSTLVVFMFGGLRVMQGDMTVGMLIAYQMLVASFVRPVGDLVAFGGMLHELHGDLNRLDDVMSQPEDGRYRQPASAAASGAGKLTGRLELRDITFGYSPIEPPIVSGFNLLIEPGQRVALVGTSGSGKSTVARLAVGLYDPWQGQVLFDGVPRAELPRQLLTDSLGVVDQEVFLFGGSVAENVAMWDTTLSAARITSACRDAEIGDVIEARPGGYQAVLEEGGKNLSGGQRQRLEIARALVGEPTLLVLDEATSALDPLTESRIVDALRRRGCACLIIAHRLSTIRDADTIVVMDRGRIVQRGTHDEMKDSDGPYRELIALS